MTQRFNAPPGWPQPQPGWAPPAGWQPDPSWPAPPPDWDYWVDDASGGPAPYGAASATSAYPGTPVGAPPGGEAAAALAQQAVGSARKTIYTGLGLLGVGIVVNVVSIMNPGNDGRATVWYGLIIFGLLIAIRGIVAYVKAKKVASFAPGGGFDPSVYSAGGGPPGTRPGGTVPGVTAPGGHYPDANGQQGDAPGAPRPGEYRP